MRAESSKVLVVRRLLFKFGWYAYHRDASRVPVQLGPKAAADVPGEVGDFANKPSGGKFTTPFRNLDPPPSDRKAMGAIR